MIIIKDERNLQEIYDSRPKNGDILLFKDKDSNIKAYMAISIDANYYSLVNLDNGEKIGHYLESSTINDILYTEAKNGFDVEYIGKDYNLELILGHDIVKDIRSKY